MSNPFDKGALGSAPTGNPFKPKNKESYREAHQNADTDNDRGAIHHTLGTGPNQAAPGNHEHNDLYTKKGWVVRPTGGITNPPTFLNGCSGYVETLKHGPLVELNLTIDVVALGANVPFAKINEASHRPVYFNMSARIFWGFINASGAAKLLAVDYEGNIYSPTSSSAGESYRGHITYMGEAD